MMRLLVALLVALGVPALTATAFSIRGVDVQWDPVRNVADTNSTARRLRTERGLWFVEACDKPIGAITPVAPCIWMIEGPRPDGRSTRVTPEMKWKVDLPTERIVVMTKEDFEIDGLTRRRVSPDRAEYSGIIDRAHIDQIAARDDVAWISKVGRLAKHDIESTRVLVSPALTSSYDATGEIIMVADTGLDMNQCMFYDPVGTYPQMTVSTSGSLPSLSPSSHSKVRGYIKSYGIGDFSFLSGSHGTSTSGVAAGARCAAWTDTALRSEFAGVAPGAKIIFYDISSDDQNLYLPTDITRPFAVAANAGAIASSNSWGLASCAPNDYTDIDYQIDWVREHYPYMTIVFSAGNDGPTGPICSPATFSGVSVEAGMSRSAAFPGYSSTQRALHPEYYDASSVATFSSVSDRGPTLTAPGVAVAVAYAVRGGAPGHTAHTTASGTSFAAPAIAGAIARFVAAYRDLYGGPPRISLVEAAFVVSATPTARRVAVGASTVSLYSTGPTASYGVPQIDFDSLSFAYTNATRAAWCFQSAAGHASIAWVDAATFPGSDSPILNDANLWVLSATTTAADLGTTRSTAKVATSAGGNRIVIDLAVRTGEQRIDLAVLGATTSLTSCGKSSRTK